jgi:hypothetical protein
MRRGFRVLTEQMLYSTTKTSHSTTQVWHVYGLPPISWDTLTTFANHMLIKTQSLKIHPVDWNFTGGHSLHKLPPVKEFLNPMSQVVDSHRVKIGTNRLNKLPTNPQSFCSDFVVSLSNSSENWPWQCLHWPHLDIWIFLIVFELLYTCDLEPESN